MTRAYAYSRRPRALRRAAPAGECRGAACAACPGPRVEPLEERIALAVFTVTNTADAGPGSFRQAVRDANVGIGRADTIVFDAGVFSTPREIVVNGYPEQFGATSGPLTVVGPGSHLLTIRPGNLANPVNAKALDSFAPVLNLSGMTVTGGAANSNGGGIYLAANSNVTLDDMVFVNNVANTGGAIALANNATLTMRNCTVANNRAARGGGIYFFDGGSLVMENCTVSGNTATGASQYDASGGGIYFFGAARPAPLPPGFVDRTLLVRDSTFNNNSAFGGGGAVALDWLAGAFLLRNSTLSGNTAGSSGGGIYNVAINQPALVAVENSTITGNSAGQAAPLPNAKGGGGIAKTGAYPGAVHVTSSVVSGNTNAASPDILSAPESPVTVRYSAVGSPAGFTPGAATGSNLPYGTNPLLGPLADNGGRTRTHAPLPGSPLVNAFPAAPVPADLPFDQRGPGHPRVAGGAVDIGSVERPAEPPRVTAVFVRSPAWTADFTNGLHSRGLGDATHGYAVPGGAAQLTTVPWSGASQVSVRFSGPVTALGNHLVVTGVNVPSYAATLSGYNTATNTATWNLTPAPRNDRLALDLDGGAAGVAGAGIALDGEWADGARAFPSGDGAAGGDFRFAINVLPGDVDRANNRVNANDMGFVRSRQNRNSTEVPPAGVQPYTPFADINGDGRINAVDVGTVRARQNDVLPPLPPVPLASPAPLFGDRPLRLEEDAGSILVG